MALRPAGWSHLQHESQQIQKKTACAQHSERVSRPGSLRSRQKREEGCYQSQSKSLGWLLVHSAVMADVKQHFLAEKQTAQNLHTSLPYTDRGRTVLLFWIESCKAFQNNHQHNCSQTQHYHSTILCWKALQTYGNLPTSLEIKHLKNQLLFSKYNLISFLLVSFKHCRYLHLCELYRDLNSDTYENFHKEHTVP